MPFQLIQLAGHRWDLRPACAVVSHDVTIGKHCNDAVVRVCDGRDDTAMANEVFDCADLSDHAAPGEKIKSGLREIARENGDPDTAWV